MNSVEEKCPSCQGALGPYSVPVSGRFGEMACSDACATALADGRRLSDAKEDYSTMAIGEDVLRKALLRDRG